MSKTARRVIDYCIDHDIRTLVVGYNETSRKIQAKETITLIFHLDCSETNLVSL